MRGERHAGPAGRDDDLENPHAARWPSCENRHADSWNGMTLHVQNRCASNMPIRAYSNSSCAAIVGCAENLPFVRRERDFLPGLHGARRSGRHAKMHGAGNCSYRNCFCRICFDRLAREFSPTSLHMFNWIFSHIPCLPNITPFNKIAMFVPNRTIARNKHAVASSNAAANPPIRM